jgi:hypothetical protein
MSEHAISNARGWLSTIAGAIAASHALEQGDESAEFDGETFTDAEDVLQRIHEMPLSVEVRGAWHSPGDDEATKPDEFRILLSTGGPALQLVGDLDEHGQPSEPRLQWQDWGTPWTTYHDTSEEEDEALQIFAGCFYFGE